MSIAQSISHTHYIKSRYMLQCLPFWVHSEVAWLASSSLHHSTFFDQKVKDNERQKAFLSEQQCGNSCLYRKKRLALRFLWRENIRLLFSFHPISEFVLEQKFQGKHTKTQSLFTIFLSILGSTYFFPFSMLILTRRLGENKVTTNLKRSSENINPSTNPKKGESKYFPP